MKKKLPILGAAFLLSLTSCSNQSGNSNDNANIKAKKIECNLGAAIKKGKNDCGTSKYSCAGNNPANDPEAWIMLPVETCNQLMKGDTRNIDENLKSRLHTTSTITH
ncbi:MAG TPA: DUF2282 domain-containing protein, partial [Candidatus Megaira endosymbiont of Hartmannula sinica]|nr:DUF2282 domain-containing protein [Candidatus Megaera endosymbiont of Hartmannula sinica]